MITEFVEVIQHFFSIWCKNAFGVFFFVCAVIKSNNRKSFSCFLIVFISSWIVYKERKMYENCIIPLGHNQRGMAANACGFLFLPSLNNYIVFF